MDLRKLKKLIDLVEESSITELEINDAEERVRIVKHGAAPFTMLTRCRRSPPAPVVAPHRQRSPLAATAEPEAA
jgi:acetyl-CoA carboxylase biotin carboxyl carrier protein